MPHYPTITRTCQQCGAEFLVEPFKIKAGKGLFCSKPCMYAGRKLPDLQPLEVNPDGLTVTIPLRAKDGSIKGHAMIDSIDVALSRWRWCLSRGYAVRGVRARGGHRLISLHRQILGLTFGDGVEVDHINRNKLDNRRSNLRIVTHGGNMQIRGLIKVPHLRLEAFTGTHETRGGTPKFESTANSTISATSHPKSKPPKPPARPAPA